MMDRKEYRELSCRDTGADCDFLVLATVVRETIGAYKEARRIG